MKKLMRFIVLSLLFVFVIIQFFQPEKNQGDITSNHIFEQEIISDEIISILENACLDCHSNQTEYLWYHKIAPVSWMVSKHVDEGKKELNLSEWGQMDVFDKIGNLQEICEEVQDNKMPIKSYVKMHKKADLSKTQIDALCAWTEKLSEEMLTKIN